jgi:hypothetical protein
VAFGSIVGSVLSALDQGFEISVIADACRDVTDEAHERAIERMVQAGAQPMCNTCSSCSAIGPAARPTRDHGSGKNLRRRLWARPDLRQDDAGAARQRYSIRGGRNAIVRG